MVLLFLVFNILYACDVAFISRDGLKIRKGAFVRKKHLEMSVSYLFFFFVVHSSTLTKPLKNVIMYSSLVRYASERRKVCRWP